MIPFLALLFAHADLEREFHGKGLIFFSFLFGKSKENHPKKQGFFLSAEPLKKSLGKKGKTLTKARTFLATKKSKEIQKSKERKFTEKGEFAIV